MKNFRSISTVFYFSIFTSLVSGSKGTTGSRPAEPVRRNHTERDVLPLRFPYGEQQVRGVNLGGWLVLEPWITPSLFDNTGNNAIVDEFTFCSLQDRGVATATLQQHWDTFITEDDFAQIAAAGLNHVRLPIGFWAFDVSGGEPYIQGQYDYLKQAVGWAQNYGIKVLIDLHGAPGSQNGFDNSGLRGTPEWQTSSQNVQRTSNIIISLAAEFSQPQYGNVVTAIAPLNEPAGFFSEELLDVTRQYWYDSYGNIRFPFGNSQEGPLLTVLHDAFQPPSYWEGFMPYPPWQGVGMDTHIYQMFDDNKIRFTEQQHIMDACNNNNILDQFTLWPLVGEWTVSMTDCTPYLNGRGTGSRYEGTLGGSAPVGSCSGLTGDSSTWSQDYKTFLRQMFEAQTSTFEGDQRIGWMMWTWKAELADDWSYQKGLSGGWIPQDPTDRQYPNICG